MSVLSAIKGKIVNVQQDISEGLRNLTKANTRSKSVDSETQQQVDSSASIQLLSRYQKTWAQLHQTSESLAQRAQYVDGLVTNIFQYMDQQNAALRRFYAELSGLAQLVADINIAKNKIVSLGGAFSELESLLVELEDICDEKNQFQKKKEHENEFKKYQQSKINELEQVKASLAKKHASEVQKYEQQVNAKLQERQKVFEEAFREQMIKYMTTGKVDYMPSSQTSNLAEIEIEQDQEELDKFLGSTEETVNSFEKTTQDVINSDSDDDIEMETIHVLKDEVVSSELSLGISCMVNLETVSDLSEQESSK